MVGRSTIIDIVHHEGEQCVAATQRTRAVLDDASEAHLAMLGPAVTVPDAVTGLLDDEPPFDDSEEAQAEWEQTQAEWIATGFPGCQPAFPVAKDEPREEEKGFVIVEPDEVKTKAQPSTGRKEVWTYTAVVLVAGLRYAFADATAEGLWLQVAALMLELGVLGRAAVTGLGRRCRVDPDVVRGPGDSLQSNDLMLVAPSEAVLRIDEFGGRPQGSSPGVREGAAGTVGEGRWVPRSSC